METKLIRDMTCSELCTWLRDQKINKGYCTLLTETHQISGTSFLCLTMDILDSQLGITAWGPRSDIYALVTKAKLEKEPEEQVELYTGRWQKSKTATAKKKQSTQTADGTVTQKSNGETTVTKEALNSRGKSARTPANKDPGVDKSHRDTAAKTKAHKAEPIPLCYSYKLRDTVQAATPFGAAGAFIPSTDKLWPKEKQCLKVIFMDDVPNTWKYGFFNDYVTKIGILNWAMIWHDNLQSDIDDQKYIPEFVPTHSMHEADIRVRFGSDWHENWSMVGTDATQVDSKQPTMCLYLGSPNDDYKQHMVCHEFGHALGLGHEHQGPEAPALLEEDALISLLAPNMPGDSEAARRKAAADRYKQDYEQQQHSEVADGAVIAKYDPKSIMHYWIPSEWLKDPAKHPKGIGLPLPTVPSDTDLRTLAESYKRRAVSVNPTSKLHDGPALVSIATVSPPTPSDGYSKLMRKRETLIRYIAAERSTRHLADILLGNNMITHLAYEQAIYVGPNITESERTTSLFNAVLASVELDPAKYFQFLHILKQLPGSEDLVTFIEAV